MLSCFSVAKLPIARVTPIKIIQQKLTYLYNNNSQKSAISLYICLLRNLKAIFKTQQERLLKSDITASESNLIIL